jgi:membrane protein DedA with SNARE-associated domain
LRFWIELHRDFRLPLRLNPKSEIRNPKFFVVHHLLEIWAGWVLNGGYTGIIVLMAMESSIFPVPSEVVIPPAAFLAAQGKLSFTGVVVAGTVGSYLGSAITYWVSRLLGRPLILKFGRFLLVSPKKLEQAEHWLARYEAGSVFFARLLPVVRHLISIPAGIVRMKFGVFSLVTTVGSALWCWILAYLGDQAYHRQPDLLSNPDAMVHFIKAQSLWIVILALAFGALYFLAMRLMQKSHK